MSTADVEDLLAERGVIVSRETIRLWVNRFGAHFADCIRRDRPSAADKWHLYEVVIPINRTRRWLWRTVDADGDVLVILVQPRRNAKAPKRFLKRLIAQFGAPRVVVTDKLHSYFKPIRDLAPNADHWAHKGLNNRECPIFCVTGIWFMLPERSKDDDDDDFQGTTGRTSEGLRAA